MYFKAILLFVLIVMSTKKAVPCDVCGTSGASNQFGILSGSNKHFIGVQYRNRWYNSIHPSLFSNEMDMSYNSYVDEIGVAGRWVAAKRVHIYTSTSFMILHDDITRTKGLTDFTVRMNYAIIQKSDTTKSVIVKQSLWLNGGMDLPTGRVIQNEASSNLYSTLSPGSGSFDYLAGIQYHLKAGDKGLSAESVFQINGANYYRYQFGRSINTNIMAFKSFELGDIDKAIIPQLGANHLYAQQDILNASKGEMNPYSGGNILSLQFRVDLMINSLAFYGGFQLPVWQDYAQGLLTKKHEITAGINWFIN